MIESICMEESVLYEWRKFNEILFRYERLMSTKRDDKLNIKKFKSKLVDGADVGGTVFHQIIQSEQYEFN